MHKFIVRILEETKTRRKIFFLLSDSILVTLSIYLAFLIRFEGKIPNPYWENLWIVCLTAFCIKIPVFYGYGLHSISWRFVGLHDLWATIKAVTISSIVFAGILFMLRMIPILSGFPRSVLFIDYALCIILIGGIRFSKRLYLEGFKRIVISDKRHTLLIGAGSGGEEIARDMLRTKNSPYFPVGFVDDNPRKKGMKIHGVKVYGGREIIPDLIENLIIDEVLIAMPSAPSREIRDIVRRLREAGVKDIKILPSLQALVSGHVYMSDVRDVRVEDILGRESVEIDTSEIERCIFGKSVLVTGAGGSIGSELCKQIARFHPKTLVMLDMDETALFNLEKEINRLKLEFDPILHIGNIRDRKKMEKTFSYFRPNIVFHSAAYKHVPISEKHPDESVKNNIIGTRILAEISISADVDKFVLISTDKAVNPTSVMGATKRVAEMLMQSLNTQSNPTRFIAVRFGNVLESRGSVIPIFKEQIKRREPVTVTHPDMKRYFMTVSEAVLLVLQASAIGQGGEVFVLDMGEPVKILELAEEFIRLAGFEPNRDIPIVFTGIRPGEKLFEELLTAEEGTTATNHKKIYVAKTNPKIQLEELCKSIEKLEKFADMGDKEDIVSVLREIVPTYRPERGG